MTLDCGLLLAGSQVRCPSCFQWWMTMLWQVTMLTVTVTVVVTVVVVRVLHALNTITNINILQHANDICIRKSHPLRDRNTKMGTGTEVGVGAGGVQIDLR